MIIEKHFEILKKMFFEEGIKSFTMDVICRRLGIAKKTLYKEFANRKELVNAMFYKEFNCSKQELKFALSQCSDPVEQLCAFFVFLSKRQNKLSSSTLSDLWKYHPSLNSEIIELENQLIIGTTVSILAQGISELYFREDLIPERIGGIFTFFS